MINGQYASIAAQVALSKRLDTIANNVANMSTTGFRSGATRFGSIFAELSQRHVDFPEASPVQISRKAGPAVQTSNPFDLLIQGDAWFAVETPAGRAYTRDGRFKLSTEGQLTALDGSPVLDNSGSPIAISTDDPPPSIGRDGTIMQRGQPRGNVGLFKLEDAADLNRLGYSRVSTRSQATPITDFQSSGLVQGSIEGSNVNAIAEMQSLVSVQKLFEMVNTSIETIDSVRLESLKTIAPAS